MNTAADDLEDLCDEDLSPRPPSMDPVTVAIRALIAGLTVENSPESWKQIRALVDEKSDEHRALRRKAASTIYRLGVRLPLSPSTPEDRACGG